MQTLKHFIAILLMALLAVPPVLAQDAPRGANQAVTQDVTIIIQQQQVRFAAQRVVEQLHLRVTDQTGEVVFDSGAAGVQEIFWTLQLADGSPLKSGLYAYTLTVKDVGKDPQVRRGHFIVDRVQDRDGADKLWVTSQNTEVGTELTVARNENSVVAGTTTGSERTLEQRSGGLKRDNRNRGVETGAQSQTDANTTTALTAGTAGYIAKFTSASDLSNSVMAESNGNVGIGTTTAVSKLDVRGHFTLEAGVSPVLFTAASGGEQNRFLQLINSPSYNSASGLKAGGILVSDSYNFANPGKNNLIVKGAVGIGTPNPAVSGLHIGSSVEGGQARLQLDNANGTSGGLNRWTNRLELTSSDAIGLSVGGVARPHFWLDGNGSLGLGTGSPLAKLHVNGGGIRYENDGKVLHFSTGTEVDILSPTNSVVISGRNPNGNNHVILNPFPANNTNPAFRSGNVGIGTFGPATKLQVEDGGITEISVISRNERAILSLGNTLSAGRYVWTLESGLFGTPGLFGIYNRTINKAGLQIDGNLTVTVKALQITGGADFAENFDISAASSSGAEEPKVEPGMVVTIDSHNPGKLALSTQAYDRRVAGIISGAGGVKPGMMMGQEGTLADGKHPVALSGRVYCWADASRGAIKPGDLLTTSSTPGHAMKVTHPAKAQGAIIGKAMTSLKSGKGLVLVLVSLQ